MTPRTIRLIKEARPLLWPWTVVTMLGAARALIGEFWIGTVNFTVLTSFAAFIALALLATLPFGVEFQHQTLPALLCQPVERAKVWAEKMTVSTAFTLSAAAMYYLNWHGAFQDDSAIQLTWFLVIILLTFCSAPYWTLAGKSTISGLVLNLVAAGMLNGIGLYLMTIGNIGQANKLRVGTILALSLSGVMVWLGRRKFIHFESTGATGGRDLMAGGLGRLFRPTRTSASLNLVRNELRLLAPVWLPSVLAVLCLIGLRPIRWLTEGKSEVLSTIVSSFAAVVIAISIGLAPLLAGTLSVGEERTAGTQTWNLVLPLSNRKQWLLKFVHRPSHVPGLSGVRPGRGLDDWQLGIRQRTQCPPFAFEPPWPGHPFSADLRSGILVRMRGPWNSSRLPIDLSDCGDGLGGWDAGFLDWEQWRNSGDHAFSDRTISSILATGPQWDRGCFAIRSCRLLSFVAFSPVLFSGRYTTEGFRYRRLERTPSSNLVELCDCRAAVFSRGFYPTGRRDTRLLDRREQVLLARSHSIMGCLSACSFQARSIVVQYRSISAE